MPDHFTNLLKVVVLLPRRGHTPRASRGTQLLKACTHKAKNLWTTVFCGCLAGAIG